MEYGTQGGQRAACARSGDLPVVAALVGEAAGGVGNVTIIVIVLLVVALTEGNNLGAGESHDLGLQGRFEGV